jgi:hypothetical protein
VARPILIGSLVTHNPFLPDNSRLVALLVTFLDRHWLFIPRLVIGDLEGLLL